MKNLQRLLQNPSTSDQTLEALVTAVLEDEASAYGGGLSGAVTPGFVPLFVAPTELADSPIDYGVTEPDGLTIDASGAGGLRITDSGAGGIEILDSGGAGVQIITSSEGGADGPMTLRAGLGLSIVNQPSENSGSSVFLENYDTGGISIIDQGGGIILISTDGITPVKIGPIVSPSVLYNASPTPLPDPTTVEPGTEATVSDALTPTYMGAYVSGGAVVCKVITDGATGWFTLSGSTTTPPKQVSASYAAKPADEVILYSGLMDGSQAITLPTTGLPAGKVMTVKVISTDTNASALNIATGNAGEYAGNPQLYTKPAGAAMGGVASLVWDGSAWWLLEYSQ
jgi:hypothetical protein